MSIKGLIDQFKKFVASSFGIEDFHDLIENYPMPTNSVVDFKELPPMFRWY